LRGRSAPASRHRLSTVSIGQIWREGAEVKEKA
jgi:hypothetical protein